MAAAMVLVHVSAAGSGSRGLAWSTEIIRWER